MEESFKKKEDSILSYFVKNHKVAYILGVLIVLWGTLSAVIIPKESAPFIEFGIVNIRTVYSGAAVADIDELITQKIESKIKSVNGINKITSSSSIGISSIIVEFKPDHDMIRGVSDIRSKIDEVKRDLPDDLDNDPIVTEISSDKQPFLSVLVHGDMDPLEIRDHGEALKKEIERITEVAEVQISGGNEREIVVDINPALLHSYKLTINDIVSSINSANSNLPLGNLEIEDLNYTLRLEAKQTGISDIENLYIKNNNELGLIKIKDIAGVYESGKNTDRISRLHIPGEKTDNYSELSIEKGTKTSIFAADRKVREAAEAYGKKHPEVEINFTREMADIMLEDFSTLLKSGGSSIIIVLLLIFVFVGLKEGLVASMVIPLTFLSTIGITSLLGKTLNFMSNFSMILALGILVDTAIVIVEGCHDYIRRGNTPYQAAILSLHEYKGPLLSGTLTTLAVFIPLFTLPGVIGKYLTFIPITVSIVLITALLISFLLITSYSSRLLKEKTEPGKMRQWFDKKQKATIGAYYRFLKWIIHSRFWRISVIYIIFILFSLSWLFPIKFNLFPQGDAPFISVQVTEEIGASAAKTAQSALLAEKIILQQKEVEIVNTSINGNRANISVELLAIEKRKELQLRDSQELVFDLQEEFKKITDAQVQVQNAQQGPPSESPVAIRVIAQSSEQLDSAEKVTKELKEVLKSIPGTFGVRDDIDVTPGTIKYTVNRDKALALGVNPELIPLTLRSAIQGITATTISRQGLDIDVTVKYGENYTDEISKIANVYLQNHEGRLISLQELINYEITSALNSIQRVDTDIAFTISSQLTEEGNAAQITEKFKEETADYKLPEGISIVEAGENEANAELFTALASAFVIAVMIMFLILVIQFKSYLQPLLILSTIVFAMLGVNFGLFITGTPRSLSFILGAIALAGIVVNDAIILIDQINKKREEGLDTLEAIGKGGRSRFTPIILTTLTTAAGIAPLILVDPFWAGLSYTIVFGLMVASFLTLIITPAMYYQLEKEKMITLMPILSLLLIGGSIISLTLSNYPTSAILLFLALLSIYLIMRAYRKLSF